MKRFNSFPAATFLHRCLCLTTSTLSWGNSRLKTLRPPHEIIEQSLVEQVVGRQLDAIDRAIAALPFDFRSPLPERFHVTLANSFGVRRQLFSSFQITKADVAFEGQVPLVRIEQVKQ